MLNLFAAKDSSCTFPSRCSLYISYMYCISLVHMHIHCSILQQLTILVVVLRRARQHRGHALSAEDRRINITRAGGPPLP